MHRTADCRRGQGQEQRVGKIDTPLKLATDSVCDLPALTCAAPERLNPGQYELVRALEQGNQTVSENSYEVTLVE